MRRRGWTRRKMMTFRLTVLSIGCVLALATAAGPSGPRSLLAQQPSPDAPPPPRAGSPQDAPSRPEAPKAWLGVGLEKRQECRADAPGECRVILVISSVVVGSPAEAAGVEVGDLLVSLDAAAPGTSEFQTGLDGLEVGRAVVLEVRRDGRTVGLEVMPAPRPPKPVQVKTRPSAVWAWKTPEGEVKIPIHIEPRDSTGATVWSYGDEGEGYVIVVPSEDGWRVQVLGENAEGEGREALPGLSIELRDLERHLEGVEEEMARAAREQVRYWGRVKAELGPEMAALRDSVLAEARAKLAEVREARKAYRTEEARIRYERSPHLVEITRRIAGAEFEPLGTDLEHDGQEKGLLVLRVIPGTPAFDLGLRRGDVVVEVAGAECSSVSDLRAALVDPGGESVQVKWIRKGEVMTGALND